MAQVRWSLTAGNDLQNIEDFIARDSVLHAITFVDRVVESAESLLRRLRSVEWFQSSIALTFENCSSEITVSSISCKVTWPSFFESCMVREIFSPLSAVNLGRLVVRCSEINSGSRK